MERRLKVGILGTTGMVGRRFTSLLEYYPWYGVVTAAASPCSASRTYEEAVGGRQKMNTPIPGAVKGLIAMNVNEVERVTAGVDFVFSVVDTTKDKIKAIEGTYAKTEASVVSNNSAHRWTPDVSMAVPEINPEYFEAIPFQKERFGTERGSVAVRSNCSIQSYAPVLTTWEEFEPHEVTAITYQVISGAGRTFRDQPKMGGNTISYIGDEEEKSEQEPLRPWGRIKDDMIMKVEDPVITCQRIRVPILSGYMAAAFVKFRKKVTREQLIEKLVNFKGLPQELEFLSAPKQFIQYLEGDDRLQVTANVDFENDMGIPIGHLREDKAYDYRFVGPPRNTVRGTAGGAVLCTELLTAKGYTQARQRRFFAEHQSGPGAGSSTGSDAGSFTSGNRGRRGIWQPQRNCSG